jgi:hypothetical protein
VTAQVTNDTLNTITVTDGNTSFKLQPLRYAGITLQADTDLIITD